MINPQSSNYSFRLITAFGRCSPWSLAALVARVSIRGIRLGRIIRWIISFITLATLFFILPTACVQPPIGDYYRNKGGIGDGSTDGDGGGSNTEPAPEPELADALGMTLGGWYTSLTVTMSHPLAGATIYYRAASDTTTDLSAAIDPDDPSTYTGTGNHCYSRGFFKCRRCVPHKGSCCFFGWSTLS